ncbi:hypothetical protein [Actinacidiphila acidipaludis]|uniref:Uncharacterized protein n=1 Tax=Actinacidiphila acidipaludis TaxID=2873382 RepID=A0ABS7PZ25_9ACTN|nr:hypothetical protein [Streptomyces acidipaludis]MBY8876146.1 hypothetical protein [Streptomyces acidipaludis]
MGPMLNSAVVPSSQGTHLPGWAVAVFVALWVVVGVFVITQLVRRRRRRGRPPSTSGR